MNIYFRVKKELDHFAVNIDYGFDKGVLAIRGESGAGKTTLLNCISGLTMPDEGQISVRDTFVYDSGRGISLPTRARNIGYLFQNYALFPNMTVKQNVIYGIRNKPEYRDKAKREELLSYSEYIMKTFGIEHLQQKFPGNISGGEKQRVALSRAIVTKPNLLLLDEPFSALDHATKQTIYNEFLLFKERFQIPTILITHDVSESEMFADQMILIKEGKIVEKL